MNALKTFKKENLRSLLDSETLLVFDELIKNGADLFVGAVSGDFFAFKSLESDELIVFAKTKQEVYQLVQFAHNFMGPVRILKTFGPKELKKWNELDIKGCKFIFQGHLEIYVHDRLIRGAKFALLST